MRRKRIGRIGPIGGFATQKFFRAIPATQCHPLLAVVAFLTIGSSEIP